MNLDDKQRIDAVMNNAALTAVINMRIPNDDTAFPEGSEAEIAIYRERMRRFAPSMARIVMQDTP